MIEGVEFNNDAASGKGPGSRLRLMREAKSISPEEMAKQLRFTPQRLAQIENDEYSAMGSSTFARGYLRSYARALGMAEAEVAEILRAFDTCNLGASIRTNKPVLINEKMAHVHSNAARRFGLVGFVVVVLGLVGFWWHSHDKAATVDANNTPAPAVSSVAQPPQTTDAGAANNNGTAVLQTLPIQPIVTTPKDSSVSASVANVDATDSANKVNNTADNAANVDSSDAKHKNKHRAKRADQEAPASDSDNSDF